MPNLNWVAKETFILSIWRLHLTGIYEDFHRPRKSLNFQFIINSLLLEFALHCIAIIEWASAFLCDSRRRSYKPKTYYCESLKVATATSKPSANTLAYIGGRGLCDDDMARLKCINYYGIVLRVPNSGCSTICIYKRIGRKRIVSISCWFKSKAGTAFLWCIIQSEYLYILVLCSLLYYYYIGLQSENRLYIQERTRTFKYYIWEDGRFNFYDNILRLSLGELSRVFQEPIIATHTSISSWGADLHNRWVVVRARAPDDCDQFQWAGGVMRMMMVQQRQVGCIPVWRRRQCTRSFVESVDFPPK